jgi:hypothetical protein
MSDGTLEQLFLVHVLIGGTDLGTWDSWSGGDPTTTVANYRSGGEVVEEKIPGGIAYSDLTIGRNYRLARDHPVVPFLLAAQLAGSGVTATKTPLNRDRTVYGTPTVATGILVGVTDPKTDSNSNNPATIQFVMAVNSLTAQ